MPIRKATLALTFAGGVDTKTDHKQVPVAKLLTLQNAVFTKQTTLVKRNGHSALSRTIDDAAAEYTNAVGLAARGDELIVFDGAHAYSRRESSSTWADTGEVASVVATATPIARTGTVQVIPDVAIRSGVQVVAWEDSRGGVWCEVLEESTGRILLASTQLDSLGQAPRCVYIDTVLAVLWARPTASRIYIAIINPSAPAATPTPVILTDDLSSTNPVYDAESLLPNPDPGYEGAVIAWARAGGGYRVGYIHASGVLGSIVTGLPGVSTWADVFTGPIAVSYDHVDGDQVAVIWATSTSVEFRIHEAGDLNNQTRAATLGGAISNPVRITAHWGRGVGAGGTALWWALQTSASRTDLSVITCGKATLSGTTYDATTTTLRGHELLSRAFYDGPEEFGVDAPAGDVYVMVAGGFRFYPYTACIRLSADPGIAGGSTVTVARLMPGEVPASHFRRISSGASGFERIRHVSSVVEIGRASDEVQTRQHAAPLSYRLQLSSSDGDQFGEIGIKYVTLNFDHAASYQWAELGRGLYLAGAAPSHYDGDRWAEAGYHAAPDWGYNADGSAYDPTGAFTPQNLGGSMAAGTYLYRIWYENIDAQGELHPGPVSVAVLVTLGAGEDQVSIAVPQYRLTNKRRVRVCVARSIAGQTATTDVDAVAYYRITDTDPSNTSGANCFIVNDPTVDTVTFVDSMTDAVLITKEPLYTNGGVLSNDPAPWAGDVIASGKNRLFWTDPDGLIRYGQERRDETALEAPAALSLPVPPFGGRIVGISVLDDAVIVLRENAIYSFTGPGPLANPKVQPEAYSFTPPALVPSDAGCSSPSSIATTPIGVILQTPKGIALVTRERQVMQIGNDVEGFDSQIIVRSTPLPNRHQVLLLTDSGSSLLYDYEHQQWSTFTNHEGYDAAVVDGVYHYLRTDGRVFRETVGQYADGTSHIPMVIETAWIKLTGYLQGFQKILWAKLIGEYVSAHTLRFRYRLNYAPGYSSPIDVSVDADYDPDYYGEGNYGDGPYGGDAGYDTVYQQQFHINRRCQSVSFKIEDVEAADTFGAAFELSELLVVGGVLRESFPPGPARSQ